MRNLGMYKSCYHWIYYYNIPLISRKEQPEPLLVVRITGKSVSGLRTSRPLNEPDTSSSCPLSGPKGMSP